MIASLEGTVASKGKDSLVVVVNGIGYQVYVADSTLTKSREGDSVLFYTTLIVREDSLTLYGFTTLPEKEIFEIVTTVSGVGPRLGLAILSTMSADNLRNAIASERDEMLTRVPGIGKKTAKKIVFELKDKLLTRDAVPIDMLDDTSVNADVMDALIALGFSVIEAQSAIQSLPPDAPEEVDARVLLALQKLG
ncbi:MAG: Holliday junction branch migration protein RuvA [Chloroflexota bacterium]